MNNVTEWLATQYPGMLSLTEDLVNIDGGSYDKTGVDRVADRLAEFFLGHGLNTQTETGPDFGRASFVRTGDAAQKSILFIGHRDTVFSKDEALRRPFSVKGSRAYGPGVADMKAGLAMQAYITVAMHKFQALSVPLVMMTTGDEEVSSPWSRPYLEREARNALAVFNAEPGRTNGGVVIARKGSVFFRLQVKGKPAHAGVNFFEGANAISALAHKVVALEQVTDEARGVTLNVGTLRGGMGVNTVADQAVSELDLRYVNAEDRDALVGRIEAIAAQEHVPGTRAQSRIYGEMLPMPQRPSNMALFEIYKNAAALAGFDSQGVFTGGCSDSGFTSAVGAPTLCAVGPTGGKVHTPDEFLELDTFVPRAQALALAVLGVAQQQKL